MKPYNLAENSQPFLDYVEAWLNHLPNISAAELIVNPQKVALISVDMIKGFCSMGPLSSPRVADIITPIVNLMQTAQNAGVRNFVLTQDSHEKDAVEFNSFAPHCIRGTEEAETIEAFKNLPFYEEMIVVEKNSLASGLNTGFNHWLELHPEVDTFILVGNCTDLCIYEAAMQLRLDANAHQLKRRVILPENCIATYDLNLDTAQSLNIFPHPGDLMHAVFLYHMALNGIEIVQAIQ